MALLNELRASLGLGKVASVDAEMSSFARSWSREMRESGFRHSSAQWSENIVWWSDENMTPEEAAAKFHEMWVNSSGHYANMTKPKWTVVGIGFHHDESGWWGTHVFR
ncbi:MAG: CAP domain-containing protein [Actinomycetia bacterium]|nr:CAP domain-containing protein [Actinomycetes bacterium]MCP4222826.1 CAP domain-containing protein [Actinomycetes bacterium]MCP5035339.1 CAP domain-containing protein [Actinomycetes bacterium]